MSDATGHWPRVGHRRAGDRRVDWSLRATHHAGSSGRRDRPGRRGAAGMSGELLRVERTAWELAQWEVHYLRGLVSNQLAEAVVAARAGSSLDELVQRFEELRRGYEQAHLRALRDPPFRRKHQRTAHR